MEADGIYSIEERRSIESVQSYSHSQVREIWTVMVKEAQDAVAKDPTVGPLLNETILKQPSFAHALASLLSAHFAGGVVSLSSWYDVFSSMFTDQGCVYEDSMGTTVDLAIQDLLALRQRDPASDNLLVHPFLHFKGYKAIQAHRMAHALWKSGRKDAARAIQSRCSEIFAVDIHPAAVIGPGFMIDHGTGVVVGETAVIGMNCTLMHGVTLGSTGKVGGDRHPKLGNEVFIGCGASIVGNIKVSDNCTVGCGSIVLKGLPSCVTAVGNPARIVKTNKRPFSSS